MDDRVGVSHWKGFGFAEALTCGCKAVSSKFCRGHVIAVVSPLGVIVRKSCLSALFVSELVEGVTVE